MFFVKKDVKFKLIPICLIVFGCATLSGQEHARVEQKVTIQSNFLSEKRELIIVFPKNYSKEKKYPVSYVLDGESLLKGYSDIVDYLSSKNVIPEMIIVGVLNTNRSLDLTHVKDNSTNFQPNGGGQKFESFLSKELVSFIDSSYSTASYRVLVGHSISGLFATKILLNSYDHFNAFLIMDPALWWKNMEIFTEIENQLNNPKLYDKKLFLSIANSLPSNIDSIEISLKDTTNATIGIRSIIKFNEKLHASNANKSFWRSKYYKNESHGTVSFISAYDGLKFIFDFFKRPSFQTLNDSSHIILEEHYRKVSKKMGYTISPPAYDLRGLAWRCQQLDNNYDRAFLFLELYIKHYPNDPIAYMQMGQHFDLIGNKELAQEYYQKGIKLGYNPN